jgi:hypothetical protein
LRAHTSSRPPKIRASQPQFGRADQAVEEIEQGSTVGGGGLPTNPGRGGDEHQRRLAKDEIFAAKSPLPNPRSLEDSGALAGCRGEEEGEERAE